MIGIKRILCPTDLSSEADEALRYAVALTTAYGAKLFLLYCKEDSGTCDVGSQGAVTNFEPLFTESLAPHLGLNTFCDLDWQGLVENTADVGKAIVDVAVKQEIDLVVMRSRRRPHAAILFGSTAETVCRRAPCPVLVTHPREREWIGFSTGEIDLQRILVAYDFSPDSEPALTYGTSLAQQNQAELHLIHVLPEAERGELELAWSAEMPESAYPRAARKLQKVIPKELFVWCPVTSAVRFGKPYDEVLSYAKEHRIDLICMGAGEKKFTVGALLGSNVDRVLRQAPCPILVARPVRAAGVCHCAAVATAALK